MFTDPLFDASRRRFFKEALAGAAALAGWPVLNACGPADKLAHISGSIVGANWKTGHLLRNTAALPAPSATLETDVLIVGGGISGLSAKRWLERNSSVRVLLLEMDSEPGGNARFGRNNVSAYPWGAHYLPVPDLRNTELLDFLKECGSIERYDAQGLPVYNEYHLCHDPEERLFINGYWQEGLVPDAGVPEGEKAEIRRFFAAMEEGKKAVGSDGLDAFAIPVRHSSTDAQYQRLHGISFRQYLSGQGYTSPYLLWYLEYGCKDDYGADLDTTSAWAGIHYFAARKGRGANASASSLLTWPEGNGFLMNQLEAQCGGGIRLSGLVYKVMVDGNGATAFCYDAAAQKSFAIRCKKVILATPVSVNKKLLADIPDYQRIDASCFRHTPWMIANLTLNALPQGRGAPLCWDNVLYGTPSVGYVNANHQDLNNSLQKVITHYWPLVSGDPGHKREEIYTRSWRQWLEPVVDELERAHPGIAAAISQADIWIWGHGMVAPSPGLMNSDAMKAAGAPIDGKIFFAHTDLSGISIFEEAFYQGIEAAKAVISAL